MTRRGLFVAWAEAPAKVNLALAVTGRRDDGYHTLSSVFLRLALHDHLEVRAAADPSGADELVVAGEPPDVTGADAGFHDNLVLRAAAALRELAQVDRHAPIAPALCFRLDKHIPVAAGLGGGSSDAAAALRLAAEAWGLQPDAADLAALAARIGADVPFFLSGQAAARVRGIGEVVEGLPAPAPAAGLLLVTPRERLSTATVFAALDDAPAAPGAACDAQAAVDRLADALRRGLDGPGLAAQAAGLRDANDLWPAALRCAPALGEARDVLERRLDRAVLLTGSGPTLVAIYPSDEEAAVAAAALEQDRPAVLRDARITATSSSRGGTW